MHGRQAFVVTILLLLSTLTEVSALRDLTVAHAPSPQTTSNGFSKSDWFYIGGGFSAAVACCLLLVYLLHRWAGPATQTTPPPPPSMSEQNIASLKTVPYSAPTEEEGAQPDECMICLEEFEEGELLKQLPCEHVFHPQCARSALLLKGQCPKCRAPVPCVAVLQH